MTTAPRVEYQTDPSSYKHWKLKFDGPIATLAVDINESAGLRPGKADLIVIHATSGPICSDDKTVVFTPAPVSPARSFVHATPGAPATVKVRQVAPSSVEWTSRRSATSLEIEIVSRQPPSEELRPQLV